MDPLKRDLEPVRPTGLERLLGSLAMVGMALMAVLITVTVVSRWIGRAIIPDDIMLVQELMVLVILMPLGLVTAAREHISVEVFTERAGLKAQRVLSVFGHIVGLVFAGLLLWAGAKGLLKAWATQDYYNGVLQIPMWFGQAVFVFGILLFIVRLAAMLIIDLRGIGRRGD